MEITVRHCNNENYLVQYLSALGAALAFGIVGLHLGWSEPTLGILMDKDITPVLITTSQSSWLSGFLQIGAIPGPLIGSLLSDHFGRKRAIIFGGILNTITFVLIFFAKNVHMLYVARFFSGLAVGLYFVSVPTYINEISSPRIRGRLLFITALFMNLFTLFEYCVIPFVSIQINACICLIIALVQIIAFLFVPETPCFYTMKNRDDLTEKSLQRLRQTDHVIDEMTELKIGWLKQKESSAGVLDIIRTNLNRKCLLIIVGLIITQQFSGFVSLLAYSEILFKQVHAPIPLAITGTILIASNFIVNVISTFTVDWLGRKLLYLSSALGGVLLLITTTISFYLQVTGYENIEKYILIPVIGLILYTAAFGIGLISIPYLICGEIFAAEYRTTAISLLAIIGSICDFSVTNLYQIISDCYGVYVSLWFFALFNVAGAVFGLVLIPETKNKFRTNSNRITC